MISFNDLAKTLSGRLGDLKGDSMYYWVEDKAFLKESYRYCADIVNQLVQELKKYDIEAKMNTVGSKKRNMITQNEKGSIDFDFNLMIMNSDALPDGRTIKTTVKDVFNDVLKKKRLHDCEDSKSALTTKPIVFAGKNKTPVTMDICIIKEDQYGIHRLIHQKTGYSQQDQYFWNLISSSNELKRKEDFLKPDYWMEVRNRYLDRKNEYLRKNDHDHPSCICYIEAVNEIYNEVQTSRTRMKEQERRELMRKSEQFGWHNAYM